MNAINLQNLPKIHYQNQVVITTELLAKCYGAKEIQIRQNHANNRPRFVEGVHFFKLEGDELRAFKQINSREQTKPTLGDSISDFLGQFGLDFEVVDYAEKHRVDNIDSVEIASKVKSLTLWTERGAARHSKILDSDTAWDMFDRLETAYFHADRQTIPDETQIIIRNLQTELLKSRKRMDKVWRLHQAGFSKAESSRMLGVGETTVRKEHSTLKACGFTALPVGTQLDVFGGE
ncbi:MAG: ORF6N domain-containing protein [Methylicorpusculum sp.]|uniref:ORF6N domain-containing protein n=1 Tax=Methylicorpusculum sp. TaxID=2713644 RepID=UPI002731D63A|nr:ORF6N domain-containing protein [Methylicorpusculum sp.]MDP2202428.1 ORF6N domain-containing protein [Methylicorpusculum sp.]